jgi:adenine specific DNA methylase Mod
LLLEGDNLEALKALLPYYAGKVKCIYIDPPYNTGNEKWAYNDNVNSPEIRKWLGQTVGRQAEDLSRHDKWLCMMFPRLVLLRDFLRDDGAIFISIDDNEFSNLRSILDEIFGAQNFIATVIWQKNYSPKSSAKFLSEDHDYILLYEKNADRWSRNLLPRSEAQDIGHEQTSFWLQTATDKFYPDFVCQLKDGRSLAVEYKNEKDWSNDDNKEKRRLGKLWAERSGGKCLFLMPKGPDFNKIKLSIKG